MIRFSTVTKTFGDGTTALENADFFIEPGELIVLTGPSGSGKTTMMKLLIMEHLPTSGTIEFEDIDLSKLKKNKIPHHRRKVGVVFQDYKLIPELNVWENISLPLSIANKSEAEIETRITDLLRLTSLTEKAWLFPTQLSGGEAQRVSIARALATGPKVIFADEPTGNLDIDSSLAIARLLDKINQLGTTLIFSTHDTSVINQLKDKRQIVLDKGKIISDSNPKKPFQKPLDDTKKEEKPSELKQTKSEKKESKKEEPEKQSSTKPSSKKTNNKKKPNK